VSARTAGAPGDENGLTLFVVDRDAPEIAVKSYRTIDHQAVADVELTGVRVAGDAVLGNVGGGFAAIDAAWATGSVIACADAVGAMDKALWITRDYLKTRKQFGAPLADFQALQHRLADMYVELELARASLGRGLEALALSDAKARRAAVSATKARVGRAGFFVGGQGVQLHGGIGMTEEYIIGHYFKRLRVLDTLFGDSYHHVQAYAAAA
jgi:alkylation response protein AidB-like acyl-CoA dehydrogenase